MKQIHIGIFPLAHLNVDLYALPEEGGGYFYFKPDKTGLPRIKIGLNNTWEEVVSILLHESFEFCASINNHRWQPETNGDAASYLFVFTHTEFTRICQHQAQFVTEALPKLATVYNRIKK